MSMPSRLVHPECRHTLYQTHRSARLMADDLFSKHFAIVGTTGCGKSTR